MVFLLGKFYGFPKILVMGCGPASWFSATSTLKNWYFSKIMKIAQLSSLRTGIFSQATGLKFAGFALHLLI